MDDNIDYLYERIEELDKRLQRAEKWIKTYNWLIFIEICIFGFRRKWSLRRF